MARRDGRILLIAALGWVAASCARTVAVAPPLPAPLVVRIHGRPPSLRAARPVEVRDRPVAGEALFCAGGDVMLGSNLDTAWARRVYGGRTGEPLPLPAPDSLLEPLRPLVADAAVVLVNVEGAVGEGPVTGKCRPGSTRCYQFRQEVRAAAALRKLAPRGVVIGNVANNHAMDAGRDGFDATVAHLRNAGLLVTGTDTLPTAVPLPSGDTVAVLGFSTFSAGPDARDLGGVRRHVARAAIRYPFVVVSVHMGAEGRDALRTRDQEETFAGEDRGNPVAFARTAVEAGADAVFGHGPHVLRAVEWRGPAMVVYSLGNLLTHGPFTREAPLDRGGFACVRLSRQGGVFWGELRGVVHAYPGIALPDSQARAAGLVDSLSALDFPVTGVRIVDGVMFRR